MIKVLPVLLLLPLLSLLISCEDQMGSVHISLQTDGTGTVLQAMLTPNDGSAAIQESGVIKDDRGTILFSSIAAGNYQLSITLFDGETELAEYSSGELTVQPWGNVLINVFSTTVDGTTSLDVDQSVSGERASTLRVDNINLYTCSGLNLNNGNQVGGSRIFAQGDFSDLSSVELIYPDGVTNSIMSRGTSFDYFFFDLNYDYSELLAFRSDFWESGYYALNLKDQFENTLVKGEIHNPGHSDNTIPKVTAVNSAPFAASALTLDVGDTLTLRISDMTNVQYVLIIAAERTGGYIGEFVDYYLDTAPSSEKTYTLFGAGDPLENVPFSNIDEFSYILTFLPMDSMPSADYLTTVQDSSTNYGDIYNIGQRFWTMDSNNLVWSAFYSQLDFTSALQP